MVTACSYTYRICSNHCNTCIVATKLAIYYKKQLLNNDILNNLQDREIT